MRLMIGSNVHQHQLFNVELVSSIRETLDSQAVLGLP